MNIKKIKIALLGISILIVVNLVTFIFFFHSQNISKSISDWASFADYISGTTNVLLSLMTLLVTLFIAYEISNLDEKRNNSNIEYDKKKFIREMREKEYSDITENLNNFWTIISNENRKVAKYQLFVIRQKFMCFLKYKKHLFPNLNPVEFKNLDATLIEFIHFIEASQEVDSPKSIELVDRFQKEVSTFHKIVQKYIVSE